MLKSATSLSLILTILVSCAPKPYYVFGYEHYSPRETTEQRHSETLTANNTVSVAGRTDPMDLTIEKVASPAIITDYESRLPNLRKSQIQQRISSYQAHYYAADSTVQAPVSKFDRSAKRSMWLNLSSSLSLLLAIGPNLGWLALVGFFTYFVSMILAMRGTKAQSKSLRKNSFRINLLLSIPWLIMAFIIAGWVTPIPLALVFAAITGLSIFQVRNRP
jgi:hypothetical protein